MDLNEPTTVEDLVRHYTPELVPKPEYQYQRFVQFTSFLLGTTIAYPLFYATLGLIGVSSPGLAIVPAVMGGLGVAFAFARYVRSEQEDEAHQFSAEIRDSPWKFYEAVALKFETEINRQRARTIGPDTEWGRARLSLENAADEAERSVAYWTQRLTTEPGSAIAQAQLAAATRLREKFRTALSPKPFGSAARSAGWNGSA